MRYQPAYRFAFARYPAVRLAVLFAAGIGLGSLVGGSLFWILFAELILLLMCAGLEWVHQRHMNPRMHKLAVWGYLLLIVGAGWWHFGTVERQESPGRELQRFRKSNMWEKVRFHGRVEDLSYSDERMTMVVEVDSLSWGDSLSFVHSFTMRATKTLNPETRTPAVRLGDYIVFDGTVYPARPPRNPHQFDYPAYLRQENIDVVGGVDEILRLRKPPGRWSWIRVRRYVHGLIEHNFSREREPLAKAILIGDKTELTEQTSKAFSRAGLAHIMAVSGMHVGFLVAPCWLLIPWCWRFRWGKVAGLAGIGGILIVYAGVTGFSASVVRASLMAVLLAYGKLYHRRRHSVNLAGVAVLILLAVDPRFLFDVGFQLSFAAVFTILLVWPWIDGSLGGGHRKRWWHGAVQLFVLSLLVQVGLLPLLARYFGEVSLVGPLVNMIVMAGVGLLIQWGLLCLLISAWLPSWGALLNEPVDALLGYMQLGVEWTAQISWSWMTIRTDHPLWLVLWGLILLAVASSHMPRHRWKLWILVLSTLCLWQADRLCERWYESRMMRVTVLDVGQGDALLVQTPAQKAVLIDAGRWTPDHNSGKRLILPHLEAEGIDTLHAVILSHPHADHIGGMEAILKHIPVKKVYHSGEKYNSKLFDRIRRVVAERKIEMNPVRSGQQISLGSGVRCYVLGPQPSVRRSGDDINNRSVIVQFVYGDQKFLFMGDAGQTQEERLIERFGTKYKHDYETLQSDYLKVGHHGSNTSSTDPLLKRIRPEISVVSLALKNRYRHPHPEAVKRLRKWTADTLHFTSLGGAVIYETDGKTLRLVNWDNQQF